MQIKKIKRELWIADWEEARSAELDFPATPITEKPQKIFFEEYEMDKETGYSLATIEVDYNYGVMLKNKIFANSDGMLKFIFLRTTIGNNILPFIFILARIEFNKKQNKAKLKFKSLRFLADAVVVKEEIIFSHSWDYIGGFFSSNSSSRKTSAKWVMPATRFVGISINGVPNLLYNKGDTLKKIIDSFRSDPPSLMWELERIDMENAPRLGFLVNWGSRQNIPEITSPEIIRFIRSNLELSAVDFTTQTRNIYYGVEDSRGNIPFGGLAVSKKFLFGNGNWGVEKYEGGAPPDIVNNSVEKKSKNTVNKGNNIFYKLNLEFKHADLDIIFREIFGKKYYDFDRRIEILFSYLKLTFRDGKKNIELGDNEKKYFITAKL